MMQGIKHLITKGATAAKNQAHADKEDIEAEVQNILAEWKMLSNSEPGGKLTMKQRKVLQKEKNRQTPVGRMELIMSDDWSELRLMVARMIFSDTFEFIVGFIVLANFICIACETDFNASGDESPMWIRVGNMSFTIMYALELAVRLYVEQVHFPFSAWNNFDAVIVCIGILGDLVQGVMEQVSVLRTLRLLRSLRLGRLLFMFPELGALIRDQMRCMRTLLWASFLIFISLTMFSIFAVELVHPIMADIAATGVYEDSGCSWCATAFSSVMDANITLFQIVSGDGWSTLVRPIIDHSPWMALMFIGIIFTMSFGLLNVLIAVMCENAAAGRAAETHLLALERAEHRERAKLCFTKLCSKLDTDNSGELSLEEMKTAVEEVPAFSDLLTVMDIEVDDIDNIFRIIDEDKSGSVSPHEFSEQLWRMKEQETRTMLMYVKFYVKEVWDHVCHSVEDGLKSTNERIEGKLRDVVLEMKEAFRHRPTRSNSSMNVISEVAVPVQKSNIAHPASQPPPNPATNEKARRSLLAGLKDGTLEKIATDMENGALEKKEEVSLPPAVDPQLDVRKGVSTHPYHGGGNFSTVDI